MSHPIQNDNPLCIIFFALTRQNYRCEKCCVLFIKYFFNEAITVIEILAHFPKQCSSLINGTPADDISYQRTERSGYGSLQLLL